MISCVRENSELSFLRVGQKNDSSDLGIHLIRNSEFPKFENTMSVLLSRGVDMIYTNLVNTVIYIVIWHCIEKAPYQLTESCSSPYNFILPVDATKVTSHSARFCTCVSKKIETLEDISQMKMDPFALHNNYSLNFAGCMLLVHDNGTADSTIV